MVLFTLALRHATRAERVGHQLRGHRGIKPRSDAHSLVASDALAIMLVRTLRASPTVAGIVDVPARRHDQPYARRAFLPESALAPPLVAIAIQIAIRGYYDGHT